MSVVQMTKLSDLEIQKIILKYYFKSRQRP